MAATTVVIGRVAPRAHSAAMFMRDGANRGTWRQVEPTRTPITQLPDVCDVCGGVGCDCITPQAQAAMLARIDADPHGYNDLTDLDIPL